MKSNNKSYTIYSLAIVLFALSLTSCESKSEKVEDAEENVEAAAQDLEIAKNEYEIEMNTYKEEIAVTIAKNDSSIAALYKKQMKKGDAKLKLEIAKLEQANEDLKLKMTEAKIDSKEKWDEFKAEFNRDMDGLGEALSDLVTKNK
jgi:hypothetical protein